MIESIETMGGQVERYVESSTATNTKRAYYSDWRAFCSWCLEREIESLPATASTVAEYLTFCAGRYRSSTIDRKRAAISVAHKAAGMDSPCRSSVVQSVCKGIKRTHGSASEGKRPVRLADIKRLATGSTSSLRARRDYSLLLICYAGAMRRSEVVGINLEDIRFVPEGLLLSIRRSKTDQEGQGFTKAIPFGAHEDTCPVRCIQNWITAANILSGPLFRPISTSGKVLTRRMSDRMVAMIVKSHATAMGLDPRTVSGHSLRAGLVTDAFASNVPESIIMAHTGHKSLHVLSGYRREANLFKQNAVSQIGL